jgi:hypothetical protein
LKELLIDGSNVKKSVPKNILALKKYLIKKYASWNVDIGKDQVHTC